MTKEAPRADREPTAAPEAPSGTGLTFTDYQRRASETSHLPLEGPQSAVPPMLGLASETGAILDSHKRYLRDRIDLRANREFLREELGDLLWYTAAVATASDLDLADIAARNLARTRDLYAAASDPDGERLSELPVLDKDYPIDERFPRLLVVQFTEERAATGRLTASLKLIAARPNAYPDGQLERDGKKVGFTVGAGFGDSLTDHSRRDDAYRFHDAIHLAFMAVLGWSPTMRVLLKLKRKSDTETDHAEDSARAIFAEEGISAVLSRFASRRLGFLSEASVDGFVIDVVKAVTRELEVEPLPGWAWRRAISQGFFAMKMLADNRGGLLTADLDARELWYSTVEPDLREVHPSDRRFGFGVYTAPALRDAVRRLHTAKTRMYGDAWKRRGEVLGVMSNLARKVDRLQMVGTRGHGTSDAETDLDTAIDLFVYSLKYLTFLADADAECASALFPAGSGVSSPFSDSLLAFDSLLARRDFGELAAACNTAETIAAVVSAFADLEKCFVGVQANMAPIARLSRAQQLTAAAIAAVGAMALADLGAYRRFLAADRADR